MVARGRLTTLLLATPIMALPAFNYFWIGPFFKEELGMYRHGETMKCLFPGLYSGKKSAPSVGPMDSGLFR